MKEHTQTRGKVTTSANTDLCQTLSYADNATTFIPRLLVYIDYISKNGGKIDLCKITPEELEAIEEWSRRGLIDYTNEKITLTLAFYQIMCQILWEAYVVH